MSGRLSASDSGRLTPRQSLSKIEHAARCTRFDAGEGTLELTLEYWASLSKERGRLEFSSEQLWQWGLERDQKPRRISGASVKIAAGDRCVATLSAETGELMAVQLLMRMTGSIALVTSSSVGHIEPDEAHHDVTGSSHVLVRLSQFSGVRQLPPVGSRVEFQLAPHPERAGRLWAAEVQLVRGALLKSPMALRAKAMLSMRGRAPSPSAASRHAASYGADAPGERKAGAKFRSATECVASGKAARLEEEGAPQDVPGPVILDVSLPKPEPKVRKLMRSLSAASDAVARLKRGLKSRPAPMGHRLAHLPPEVQEKARMEYAELVSGGDRLWDELTPEETQKLETSKYTSALGPQALKP